MTSFFESSSLARETATFSNLGRLCMIWHGEDDILEQHHAGSVQIALLLQVPSCHFLYGLVGYLWQEYTLPWQVPLKIDGCMWQFSAIGNILSVWPERMKQVLSIWVSSWSWRVVATKYLVTKSPQVLEVWAWSFSGLVRTMISSPCICSESSWPE